MHKIEAWLETLESSLDSKRKRHIAGGILMSISVLFGGLAFTVLTAKMEGKYEE